MAEQRQGPGDTAGLIALLEQHWLHARHVESERAWFMSAYSAITGGIITYLFSSDTDRLWPGVFLLVLTFIGFALNWRWAQAFEHYQQQAADIGRQFDPNAQVKVPRNGVWRVVRTNHLFLGFYGLAFVGLLVMLAAA